MTSLLRVAGLVLCAIVGPVTMLWPNVDDQLRGKLSTSSSLLFGSDTNLQSNSRVIKLMMGNVTSSIKPEVDDVSQRRQKITKKRP